MVLTRSRSSALRSTKKVYAARVRSSPCRKLGAATCRRTSGCKRAAGSKRSFCRKSKNRHV